jgi:hypothetical protein
MRWIRSRRRIGLAVAGLFALAVIATAAAAQSSVLTHSSTFDSGIEGWVAVQEPSGSVGSPTWKSAGGNPGGYITAQFSNGNGMLDSSPTNPGTTWPAGIAVDDYGGTLRANVRLTLASPSDTNIEIGFLSSNSVEEPCVGVHNPGSGWITVTATLKAPVFGCLSPFAISAAQVNAALAGFKGMLVYAVDASGVSETLDVDNAELKGPPVAGSHPTGTVARYLTLAYKSGKFHGTLSAAYDFSCALRKGVTIFRKAATPVKVGTTTTSASTKYGSTAFTFTPKKIVKGSYYATVPKAKSSLDGNTCPAAKSSSAAIR